MNHQKFMGLLARWHIWLGWAVALPLLLWIITGLVMVIKPIEEVRGEEVRVPPALVETGALILPQFSAPITSAKLLQQADGPVWIIAEEGGGEYRYSARDGTSIPPLVEEEARAIANASYAGKAELEDVSYFPPDAAPADLRRKISGWQAHYSDGTNLYIADATGEVLAIRTQWWGVYDFMWGLHIMDPQTREDAHNPFLISFAVLALLGSVVGSVLLFRRRKPKKK